MFYAWIGMLLKGMGESFLLSKDESLTLDIDGVMALWMSKRGAQTTENRRKLDLSILVFTFCPRPLEEIRSKLLILELPKRPR